MFADAGPGHLQVKICGVTNAADAEAAIECGADALGFNFFRQSRRYVAPTEIGGWATALQPGIRRVAILVNPTLEEAIATARLPFIDALQLHGAETVEFCRHLSASGISFAKAVAGRVSDTLAMPSFSTNTIVLDSMRGADFGGTGETFPWEIAREMVERHPELRVVLAGGLTPENAASAVEKVRPFGLDVASGVEWSPGVKDKVLIREFIAAARSV